MQKNGDIEKVSFTLIFFFKNNSNYLFFLLKKNFCEQIQIKKAYEKYVDYYIEKLKTPTKDHSNYREQWLKILNEQNLKREVIYNYFLEDYFECMKKK